MVCKLTMSLQMALRYVRFLTEVLVDYTDDMRPAVDLFSWLTENGKPRTPPLSRARCRLLKHRVRNRTLCYDWCTQYKL